MYKARKERNSTTVKDRGGRERERNRMRVKERKEEEKQLRERKDMK